MYLIKMNRSFYFCLILMLLEIRNSFGEMSNNENKLFYKYYKGYGHLRFAPDDKVIDDQPTACVTALKTCRYYKSYRGTGTSCERNFTVEDVDSKRDNGIFIKYPGLGLFLSEAVTCKFPASVQFAIIPGGFMVSLENSDTNRALELIPALADDKCVNLMKDLNLYGMMAPPATVTHPQPRVKRRDVRNSSEEIMFEERQLFRNYCKGMLHMQFKNDSKVFTNQPGACITAYNKCRHYGASKSQVILENIKVITESVRTEIANNFHVKGPVSIFSQVVKCFIPNGDKFVITPGGFMVSVTDFQLMEHILELADKKCIDLINEDKRMKLLSKLRDITTLSEEVLKKEELKLFRNYFIGGGRPKFEKDSEVTSDLRKACVTAYNESRTYKHSSNERKSNGKGGPSADDDITAESVRAVIDEMFLINSHDVSVLSHVVKCFFANGHKFVITPAGFLASFADFKVIEHIPSLSDNKCLNIIQEMNIYGVSAINRTH